MNLKNPVARLERRLAIAKEDQPFELDKGLVDPKSFVEGTEFMDAKGALYPAVLESFIELNSGEYCEAVLTGGIGCGKTTLALFTTAYQLYKLSCMEDPQGEFSLSEGSEIVFIFQSITENATKNVSYPRFKEMIDRAPYFQKNFQHDKTIERELRFPNNIIIRPVSGRSTAAIGQNVIGGVIDEVNYMEVVPRSRRSADGGDYDQAMENYNAISRRRKSRFMKNGELPGMLCLVSSKRFPGQFTDIKAEEAEKEKATTGTTSIYVYDKRAWEIRPIATFSGAWFKLFVGDSVRPPRILKDKEPIAAADQLLVMKVPEEYRVDFERDILAAVRDIAGVSKIGRHPFFVDRGSVAQAFGTTTSILSRDSCDFVTSELIICRQQLAEVRRSGHLDKPRFAHIDLARTNDSAGVACGYVEGFVKVPRGDGGFEDLPQIVFDFVLEVPPPPNGEINFARIRALFYGLEKLRLPLRWISMDTYQSTDMEQILRQHGFCTGTQSMDRSTLPYDITKTAIADGRLRLPRHDKALRELVQLERDPMSGKIDHPPKGSKDLADAIAGVVYGLTRRRATWANFGVWPSNQLVETMIAIARADEEREASYI